MFTITAEDFPCLPDRCPVLGIPLKQGIAKRDENARSLDRHDNSKGYTPDNVNIISLRANMLKSDATFDESMKIVYYQAEAVDWLGLENKESTLGS